jgi:hypothetical protein
MKAYWRSVGIDPGIYLASELHGRELSASLPCHFIPKERAPGTHRIGGWVAPEPFWTGRGGEEKNSQPPPSWCGTRLKTEQEPLYILPTDYRLHFLS